MGTIQMLSWDRFDSIMDEIRGGLLSFAKSKGKNEIIIRGMGEHKEILLRSLGEVLPERFNHLKIIHSDSVENVEVLVSLFPLRTITKGMFQVFGIMDSETIQFSFPWETAKTSRIDMKNPEDLVRGILEHIGENPERDGLIDTPKRVVKSWKEIFGGYTQSSEELLSTAFDNDGNYDEMVVLTDISFHSMCEHHMLPFIGKAHIAYIPSPEGKVVGISKLARLVEAHAQRLQIQEKMTKDIATDLETYLNTNGVAVVIEAQHLCMKMRGVKNHSSWMKTSSLTGVFKQGETRAEFLSLIRGK